MQRSPAPLSKLLRHRTPDEVLDEAVALTFPASDPISPAVGPGEPLDADEAEDDAD